MNINILKDNFSSDEILAGKFGIEREGLRVTPNGELTKTPHPEVFGDKLKNPYITTDFSESQVEVITPPLDSIHRSVEVLETLVDIVNNEIRERNEMLWPASMPCKAPGNIPIAHYGDDEKSQIEAEYRKGLITKYGGLKQLLTGIHFNFSFSDTFLDKLRKLINPELTLREFKDKVYLKIARNYLRLHFLLVYLTGSSVSMHESYDCVRSEYVTKHSKDAKIMRKGPSLRNSPCGYKNLVDLFPSYNSIDEHIEDVNEYVESGLLALPKELYSQVRLKPKDKTDVLKSLKEDGIEYLEIRTIDLNLFEKAGVSERDLDFLHLLLIYCLIRDEVETDNFNWQMEALENENAVSIGGFDKELLVKKDGETVKFQDYAVKIIDNIAKMAQELGLGKEDILHEMKQRVLHPEATYAYSMYHLVKDSGYIPAMMKIARKYAEDSYDYRYLTRGFQDYELSTQILIKEALTRGVTVDEIDSKDNFLRLSRDGKESLVKQATKTELDNYASVLAMENKVVTKKILKDRGVKVPEGEEYTTLKDFEINVSKYIGKPIVIKPKSTNFGLGIFIFNKGGNQEDLTRAAKEAFTYDDTILVENFLEGTEFRFLVIDDLTVAVLKRVPANVVGDGIHSIKELIDIKNQHPFRGEGYSAPMKKIKIDEQTLLFLKEQGKDINDIPENGQLVFLRGNSNISTGGDSIDVTEQIPQRFKDAAVDAAKAIGAVFCGVDVLIEDVKDENSDFGIIELNFNPSTDMHAYPMEGLEHKTGAYILSALGLIDTPLSEIKPKVKNPDQFKEERIE